MMKLKKSNVVSGVLTIALILVSLLFVIPVVYCIATSFKTTAEVLQEVTFLPRTFTLENYIYVFEHGDKYLIYFWNSIVVTLVTVSITLVLSALAGYAFAKLPFRGSGILLAGILFVMAFPLVAMIIPIYMMEYKLGLINTHIGLILPNIICVLPFSIFIMRGTFIGLPNELEESAEIDGCSGVRTWWNIMLPLAKNALIIVIVSAFYNVWGEFTIAKTLATKEFAMPVTVGFTLLKGEDWNFGVLSAAITLTIIPPIAIFTIFQKHLVEGMVAGSVKG